MRDALGAVQSMLVLGGTSEIALATARRLVARGCRLVVLAVRDPDTAAGATSQLERLGASVDVVAFDALDTSSHQRVIGDVFDRHGDIDLVLLAFGVLGDQNTFDHDPTAAAAAVSVNYVGAVTASLAVAERFRDQGHGTLVVLSSVAAERARRTNFVYGSSKAGLDAFTQGLGDALAGTGARTMVVRPGFVHTRMTEGLPPQPFATSPEAVAEAIERGLARGDEIIWAPAILRWVFVVMRHLPRRLWRVVSAR
ncbi:decaprenylphospho-beta-D-erythro-pentofuranosid-2-ulose 2-reductase [Rhabdothermincola sediminis]|uniref:decaprenylphospho-beta-D-erythro-pentofuranosid- 2-ulose 2-reductase n=1 Tax=Rhabdothermincola sediminis TaxID=2751370 RepID=UPI001AA09062|nr:decaprenylphospho-beta-D-erythro-pentofuranosid-2-ulose 2-reductase [Rhabdothermincola sediminis]